MKSLENTCHIPERFCGGDSLRRGAISTVCTFTFTFITRLSPPRKSGAPSRQIKWRLGATYTDQNLGHLTRSYAVDWTLLKTSACAGRVLRVSWTAHRTAEAIWNDLAERKQLVVDVAIRKLRHYGHTVRHEASTSAGSIALLTGDVEGGRRKRGRDLVDSVRHSGGPLGLTLTLTLTPGMADPRNGGPVPTSSKTARRHQRVDQPAGETRTVMYQE